MHLTVYYYMSHAHFRVNLHSIVKELLAQTDTNYDFGIQTHNHLVRKQTLDDLAKLAK